MGTAVRVFADWTDVAETVSYQLYILPRSTAPLLTHQPPFELCSRPQQLMRTLPTHAMPWAEGAAAGPPGGVEGDLHIRGANINQ